MAARKTKAKSLEQLLKEYNESVGFIDSTPSNFPIPLCKIKLIHKELPSIFEDDKEEIITKNTCPMCKGEQYINGKDKDIEGRYSRLVCYICNGLGLVDEAERLKFARIEHALNGSA